MPRIIITGYAPVFAAKEGDEDQITDPKILRSLGNLIYDEEPFTEHLGGSVEQNSLALALEPGGAIKFSYKEGDDRLTAVTEYQSKRTLTPSELDALVDYTFGQWSDGIGENWVSISSERYGYAIQCTSLYDHPKVEVMPI